MANLNKDWQVSADFASKSKFKKFAKIHREEYASLFANLQRLVEILNAGHKIGSFKVGFFRSEKHGVYRIGQTRVESPKESRLYVMPDEKSKTIHILTIGTKETQSRDLKESHSLADKIRKQ